MEELRCPIPIEYKDNEPCDKLLGKVDLKIGSSAKLYCSRCKKEITFKCIDTGVIIHY